LKQALALTEKPTKKHDMEVVVSSKPTFFSNAKSTISSASNQATGPPAAQPKKRKQGACCDTPSEQSNLRK
jgi:hypothetical protein